jgi:hypothetical protein
VVKLESFDAQIVGQQAAELWQALRGTFQGSYRHRLIIVLFTWVEFALPDGIVKLDPPRFEVWHVHEWIQDVAAALDWEDHALRLWRDTIIRNCMSGHSLHIEQVYWYLARSLVLLSRKPPPRPEDFLAELY